jgi:intergrase/recombinase
MTLNFVFCSEMLSKGVQEVYVDAFCGRVPKSILARHYTDFQSRETERDIRQS